jgi:hypothetical protein
MGETSSNASLPPRECGATKGVGKLAGAFAEARVLAGCEIALRAPQSSPPPASPRGQRS